MTERRAALRPCARTAAARRRPAAARRAENDAIAVQVRLYREAGLPARDYPPLVFSCECGEAGCRDTFELSLEDYERLSGAGDRSPLRPPTP